MGDRNPLVASGEYERTYVCELSSGDVLATGETVVSVGTRGETVSVACDNDTWVTYGHRDSTVLVKVK